MNRSEKLLQMFEIMSSGEKHALEIIREASLEALERDFGASGKPEGLHQNTNKKG